MKNTEEFTNLKAYNEKSSELDQLMLEKKNALIMLKLNIDEKSKEILENKIEQLKPQIKEVSRVMDEIIGRIRQYLAYQDKWRG